MDGRVTAVACVTLSPGLRGKRWRACAPDSADSQREWCSLVQQLAQDAGAEIVVTQPSGLCFRFERCNRALDFALEVRTAAQAQSGAASGIGLDVCSAAGKVAQTAVAAAELARCAAPGGLLLSASARAALEVEEGLDLRSVDAPTRIGDPWTVKGFPAPPTERHNAPGIYCFGDFTVEVDKFELQYAGALVPLEPLTFDLLLVLMQNSHRTVTRDELFQRLWGGRIVSDTALSSQVKMLRRALGDCGRQQRMVRTIQGRGFRFLPQVVRGKAAPLAEVPRSRPPGRPLVAVLPLENLTGNNGGPFFADGLTEDILNALSKHRWINVAPRNLTFAFRNPRERLDAIAGHLGATHVVNGSIRTMADRMRITVEAIEIDPLRRLWSDSFDLPIAEICDFPDEVSGTIAARLANELGVAELEKARRLGRENCGTWELYHLGLAEFHAFTAESNLRAQDFLRLAIRSEPQLAEVYSRLAYAVALEMAYFEGEITRGKFDEALALVLRGLDLDDRDPQAHFVLGRLRLLRREYDLAIDALTQALALNPYLAVAHWGLGDSLACEGRIEESIRHFERAIDLSPHDPFRWAFYSYMSLAFLFGGAPDAAARAARRAVQAPNAHFSAHANLLAALGHLEDRSQTERAREALLRVRPGFSIEQAKARLFYIRRPEQLENYLQGLQKAGLS